MIVVEIPSEVVMAVRSMTGYGKGVYEGEEIKLVAELKSVNHRFLDLAIKMPKSLNFAEDGVRKVLKEKLTRGHVDVFVNVEDKREIKGELGVDRGLAEQYVAVSRELADELGIENDFGVKDLLKQNNVVCFSTSEMGEDALSEALFAALSDAVASLDAMRVKEGENLRLDMLNKLDEMRETVDRIAALAPDAVKKHGEKVRERVAEYLGSVAVDESKFLNEMAFYADKVAIDEEITRLNSHIPHFRDVLQKGGAVGKQLDFIVQEMNRESNTIGSKCCDIRISECVVALKCTIEKLREQIQNLE